MLTKVYVAKKYIAFIKKEKIMKQNDVFVFCLFDFVFAHVSSADERVTRISDWAKVVEMNISHHL